ncbi:MAG: nucleotidyl transferase AbiEii/AbiGii toxin family protein [Rhodothermia bacterium]
MNAALQSLLDRYQLETAADWENALREIIQELGLLGLWRSKFYEHAAFYGGTALRIFHGLDRYSEDLDFSLLKPDEQFDLTPHLEAIRIELAGFGFDLAFIKGNTRINLLEIGAPGGLPDRFHPSQKLRIKLEVDTDPPPGATMEVKTLLLPIPFQVKLFTPPSLFAGKLHALLYRNWNNRVKGRDFYDFVWYLGKDVPVHLSHLQHRMEQTGHWPTGDVLDEVSLKQLLRKRFAEVDFKQAREDVMPFIRDPDAVVLWGNEFFSDLTNRLKTVIPTG